MRWSLSLDWFVANLLSVDCMTPCRITMISPAQQRAITNDWQAEFPTLAVYRPMWLARRCGPVLVGLCLDRGSGDNYYPTWHYHCLLQPSPTICLSLATRLGQPHGSDEYVNLRVHAHRFVEIATKTRHSALFPLDGDLSLRQFEDACNLWLQRQRVDLSPPVLAHLVMLSAWCGADWQARLRLVDRLASQWPQRVNDFIGGIDNWLANLTAAASKRIELHRTMENEITTHKLQNLPASEFTK